MDTGAPYIVVDGMSYELDINAAREGVLVFKDSQPLCEDCGVPLAECGTQYGMLGDEGGVSVLCDELSGGCESVYVVKLNGVRTQDQAKHYR